MRADLLHFSRKLATERSSFAINMRFQPLAFFVLAICLNVAPQLITERRTGGASRRRKPASRFLEFELARSTISSTDPRAERPPCTCVFDTKLLSRLPPRASRPLRGRGDARKRRRSPASGRAWSYSHIAETPPTKIIQAHTPVCGDCGNTQDTTQMAVLACGCSRMGSTQIPRGLFGRVAGHRFSKRSRIRPKSSGLSLLRRTRKSNRKLKAGCAIWLDEL